MKATLRFDARYKDTLKRIAANHGYIVKRGDNVGGGNMSALLQAIANGELYVISADDQGLLERARALAAGD